MDGTSIDRVGEGIERLEERFGSFPVNQTTLTVSGSDYERLKERASAGMMDVYVQVRNADDDVLHVGDDERSVPRCVTALDDSLARRVRETVRAETGVDCQLDGVARVTIAGVHQEGAGDEATVYRLCVLVDAVYERGTSDGGVWDPGEPSVPEYV